MNKTLKTILGVLIVPLALFVVNSFLVSWAFSFMNAQSDMQVIVGLISLFLIVALNAVIFFYLKKLFKL